jgi:hypothetical protein
LETHLAFHDYVKAFNRDKRDKLFEKLQSKNIPNLLLKRIIGIYSGNKIKMMIHTNTKANVYLLTLLTHNGTF